MSGRFVADICYLSLNASVLLNVCVYFWESEEWLRWLMRENVRNCSAPPHQFPRGCYTYDWYKIANSDKDQSAKQWCPLGSLGLFHVRLLFAHIEWCYERFFHGLVLKIVHQRWGAEAFCQIPKWLLLYPLVKKGLGASSQATRGAHQKVALLWCRSPSGDVGLT